MAKTKQPPPPEWRTEQRKIGDLVDWEKNPRLLTDEDAEHLKRSLEKFGYVQEIVINLDETMIGGHQRKKILLAHAMADPEALVDVRVPNRQLTEDEATELAIRLNRNQADWDFDMLGSEFDLPDLLEWGFEDWEFGFVEETEDKESYQENYAYPSAGDRAAPYLESSVKKFEVWVNLQQYLYYRPLLEIICKRDGFENFAEAFLAGLEAITDEDEQAEAREQAEAEKEKMQEVENA